MEGASAEQLLSLFDRSSGVTTDSRKCGPGLLYIALKGERFDGNTFAHDAIAQGCIAAVVDDSSLTGEGIVHVADGLTALQNWRRPTGGDLKPPFLASLEAMAKPPPRSSSRPFWAPACNVHATHGNLNNHIGVPLTLLSIPVDTEFALVEMGANHQGEIADLCRIAEPTHGMITNVGLAHLEGFGGVEGVKKGKQELYRWLAASAGTAMVHAADQDLMALATLDGLEQVFYGTKACPPFAWRMGDRVDDAVQWTLEPGQNAGPWHTGATGLEVRLHGAHQLDNINAAIAVGTFFGTSPANINAALLAFLPVDQRGETVNTSKLGHCRLLQCQPQFGRVYPQSLCGRPTRQAFGHSRRHERTGGSHR